MSKVSVGLNQKKTINPPMNPGISLLLVVFLVLCLFTFSAITLASALNEKNRTVSLASSTKAYYTASNKAEHKLYDITNDLQSRGEWTISSPLDLEFEIDDTQVLSVGLKPLSGPTPGKYYIIDRWQVVSTVTWETDDTMNLYIPEGN